ncbi:MAG: L,D-transpeptidase family protein [Deltaproteobacteria bacterium]|nr:MAG: L,D-transpeptidase family protein [Deltaproteobacteria bacterium]
MIHQPLALLRWAAPVAVLVVACAGRAPLAPPEAPPPPSVPEVAPAPAPPPACRAIARIEVRKKERVLEAHCERGAIVTMTAALGREPLGPKVTAGDLRTPEGGYRVSGPAEPGRFHLFIPIDYPSVEDARRALAAGRISQRDYARIARAHEQGLRPPGDTPLGGDLGFHGEGSRWKGDSVDLDWTYGCIAVTDRDIDFLAERLEVGTPVRILP